MMWRAALAAVALALPAGAGQPPAMAAVGVLDVGRSAACGGTLISPDLVLTAGHCVLRRDGEGAVAADGIVFRTGGYPGHAAARFRARDVAVHPLFVGGREDDPAWIPHDAALVRLEEPVPAAVAEPIAVTAAVPEGAPTYLASYRAGHGERARERRCPVLREWPDVVTVSCDVRAGESGSPLLVSVGGTLGVVGVVSASARTKRTETAVAARAVRLVGALRGLMGLAPTP